MSQQATDYYPDTEDLCGILFGEVTVEEVTVGEVSVVGIAVR